MPRAAVKIARMREHIRNGKKLPWGMCFSCGRELTSARYKSCGECRMKHTEYKQRRREKFPEGSCRYCGGEKDRQDRVMCYACRRGKPRRRKKEVQHEDTEGSGSG